MERVCCQVEGVCCQVECAELERCGLKWRGVLSSGGAHELQGGMNWRGVAKGGDETRSSGKGSATPD